MATKASVQCDDIEKSRNSKGQSWTTTLSRAGTKAAQLVKRRVSRATAIKEGNQSDQDESSSWVRRKSMKLVQGASGMKGKIAATVSATVGKVMHKTKKKVAPPGKDDSITAPEPAPEKSCENALEVSSFDHPRLDDDLIKEAQDLNSILADVGNKKFSIGNSLSCMPENVRGSAVSADADIDDIISRVQSRSQATCAGEASLTTSSTSRGLRNPFHKNNKAASPKKKANAPTNSLQLAQLLPGTTSCPVGSQSLRKDKLDQNNQLTIKESKIDCIIAFQLYELLQTKWRENAHNFIASQKEVDAEILNYMIEIRPFVKEEKAAGPALTPAHKTKLVNHILKAVRENIEECLLSGHQFKAFLDIALGGALNFDAVKDVEHIAKHPELSASYHRLMDPGLDGLEASTVFMEYSKPELSPASTEELRSIYDDLLIFFKYDRSETTLRLEDVKNHEDYRLMDFHFYSDVIGAEADARLTFDAFAALFCPNTSKTALTLVNVLIKRIRKRHQQMMAEFVDSGASLETALAKLEDPLSPTLHDHAHELLANIYDSIDWSGRSTEPGRVLKRFLISFYSNEELQPFEEGTLSYAEFEGLVRPEKYKLHRKASPIQKRRGVAAAGKQRLPPLRMEGTRTR